MSTAPSTANNSQFDLASKATSSDPPSFLSHLGHLLPKHALFHVRLHIHMLSSVPLVSGSFGVRWKFKNTQNAPGTKNPGLLLKVRRTSSRQTSQDNIILDCPFVDEDTEDIGVASMDSSSSTTSGEQNDSTRRLTVPSVITEPKPLTTCSRSSSTNAVPLLANDPSNTYLGFSPALRSTTPSHTINSLSSSTPTSDYITQPRGMTGYQPLKEHTVTWEHVVNSVVKMDVHRETKDLLPNYLKLVVVQQVVPGDPDAPQNPRFGSLRLNLAEYVGDPSDDASRVSEVTRRYLLAESKTNATLKLTLQLERIDGETDYVPPPLPKGEIFAGVSGLLDKEVYKVRPTAFDFFATRASIDEMSEKAKVKSSGESRTPLPIEKLPFASGPQTTESLIEALFNPVRVTDQKKTTPFTYYEPPTRPRPAASRVSSLATTQSGTDQSSSGQSVELSSGASVRSFSTESDSAPPSAESHVVNRNSPPQSVGISIDVTATTPTSVRGGLKGLWMRTVSSRPSTPLPIAS